MQRKYKWKWNRQFWKKYDCLPKLPCFRRSVLKTMQCTLKHSYHKIDMHNGYGLITCIWHHIKKLNNTFKKEIPITFHEKSRKLQDKFLKKFELNPIRNSGKISLEISYKEFSVRISIVVATLQIFRDSLSQNVSWYAW